MIRYLLLALLAFSMNYGTAQTKEEKQKAKEEKRQAKKAIGDEQYANMKKLIESKNFVFEANRVLPAGGGSITMATNPNKILVNQDEVDIDMPYFGVVRSGGGYSDTPGITFQGVPDSYEVSYVENKRQIVVRIKFKGGSESHNAKLTIGKEGQTTVLIISSGRNNISYNGLTTTIEQKGFH